MIRVLQCVNNMHRAGLETMLMNYYRNIDRTQVQFDFLTHRPDRSDYDEEIESLGGRVYYAPRLYPQNYPAYFAYMKQFFREHPEYKIMHSHIDTMSYLPLLAGKKAGVPIRIAHSHSTAIDLDFKYPLKCYFKTQIPSVTTHYYACGDEAGEFMFGKQNFEVISNAIDVERFCFDPEMREKKRNELKLKKRFVVGHIGRFTQQKNQIFLLEVFACLIKKVPEACLVLIGNGKDMVLAQEKAKQLGIADSVLFLGNIPNVNEWYQVFDVFVLPSIWEGLPVVGVEAQAADLPCIFSSAITRKIDISEKSRFIDLKASPEVWVDAIMQAFNNTQRQNVREIIADCGYDIAAEAIKLQERYLTLAKDYLDTDASACF